MKIATSSFGQSVEDVVVNRSASNISLTNWIQEIESANPVRFFYRPAWTDSITVSQSFSNTPLTKALSTIIQNTDLAFTTYQNYYIVLLSTAPVATRRSATDADNRRIIIGDSLAADGQTEAVVSGYIRDGSTGQGIAGATLFSPEAGQGTSTNANGYYSLTIPTGNYDWEITSLGYEAEARKVRVTSDGSFSVDLFEETSRLEEITITERAEDNNVSGAQMSATRMDIQRVQKMPAFLGEVDIINAIEMLPGVSVAGEGASGFNVRGGDVGQNLILLDGIPIYNPSHLFGFFSAFNADLLQDATLYKGGIPARYGGRIASVLDISTKEGNLRKLKVSGGIGVIASRLSAEIPIVKEKSSLIIGGRASYSDWILNRLQDITLRQSEASFYDANAKWTYRLNESHKIGLTGYFSNDNFGLANDATYQYQNAGGALHWDYLISQKWLSSLRVTQSRYRYQIGDVQDSVSASQIDAAFDQTGGQWNLNFFPNEEHEISGGLEVAHYQFSPGDLRPTGDFSLIIPQELATEQAWEFSGYLSDVYQINPFLTLTAGVRYNYYRYVGPREVTNYAEGRPRRVGSTTGTTTFSEGETIVTYQGWEPRAALRIGLNNRSSIKLSYNRLRQNTHLISNTASITPTDIWKLSDPYLPPQIGDQYAIGFFRNVFNNAIEASVEVYYKDILNLVEYRDGATLLMNDQLEADLLSGTGKAYGAELLVSKNIGRLTGWLAYTFSRTLRRVDSDFPEERVNRGEWYPSYFDKPHDLTVVGNYQFTRRVRLGFNFTFSTGRPITLPESTYRIGSFDIANYSDRNQYRIPAYHRLDLSFSVDGNLKKKKKWDSSWTFALYNLYGRNNPYSIFFQSTGSGRFSAFRLAILGRPFPSITYNFKF
ncbi:TonB-dependent receptor [Tunicatimonas pelagia]|uniref:TonB-dependent receptor n=1 Tax=Tunicatimonas pelagia TaxID=931531 RepID=UPI00266692DA|nr:TonB-dependent receptor [Tunicatimonas pelagia]WKN45629.1 TonB-dependent receptor [Tunicatimonas pelagia]